MTEIVVVAVVAIAALLIFASRQPDTFRIERTALIGAPPERIFPLIDDLHAWQQWSPWAKKDPNAKGDYSGAQRGPGSVFAWDGNKTVGKGRMEIVQSEPSKRVVIKLDFKTPFEAHNQATFTLSPRQGGTEVSWVMTGPMPFVSKVVCLFMNMDSMVGRDFEAGLASLKTVAERG